MLKYFMEDMDVFWYLFVKKFSYDITNLINEFIKKSYYFSNVKNDWFRRLVFGIAEPMNIFGLQLHYF